MLFYSTSYIQSTNLDLVDERIHLMEYLMDNNLAYSQEVRLHDIAQWEDELVDAFRNKKDYKHMFLMQQMAAYALVSDGHINEALEKANAMLQQATLMRYDIGIAISHYAIGDTYLNANMTNEATEISQYYDDNAETYAENRVEKIDKPMVNVRHILIEPEAAEDGTISDEAWAAAEQTANDILDQWLAGDATEESFANMANENSSDPGSNTNGGLYENVYPGQMVETFNDWCFADGRQPGDYGIVKTDYGYHIIFFVGAGDEIYWFQTAKEDYLSDLAVKIQDEITAKYTFVSYVDQAALVDVLTAANDSEAAQ